MHQRQSSFAHLLCCEPMIKGYMGLTCAIYIVPQQWLSLLTEIHWKVGEVYITNFKWLLLKNIRDVSLNGGIPTTIGFPWLSY